MSCFIAVFMSEIKRFICKKNIVLFFLVLVASLYAVNSGFDNFISIVDKVKEFENLETFIFKNMSNYTDISNMGFDVFFMPSASGILFSHPPVLSSISANINTIVTLKIYAILQSGVIFQTHPLLQFRLSSILYLLGGLLALFYGFDSLRNLEYLKFQASAASEITVYISIIVSRFLFLTLSYISVLLIALWMILLKGIQLTQIDFVILVDFLIPAMIMLSVFFLLGTAIGNIRTLSLGIAVLLASWIALVLMIPSFIDSIIEKKAIKITSNYKVYNDKLAVASNFEKKALEKNLQYGSTPMDVLRKEVENYLNNDYKEIETFEEQHKEEINQVITLSNKLYILLPSTFYILTANEASSRGYQNFLEFYSYLQIMRRQFLRFWIDRVYYNDPKVMVNFVKGNENIFKAKSQLPPNFGQGVLINLGYCIVLFFLSYFLFIRTLFPVPKTAKVLKKVFFKVNVPGVFSEIKFRGLFINYFLNVFFGRIKRFSGEFILWGENIVNRRKKDFLFIPDKDSIPSDLSVNSFLDFFKHLLKPTKEVFQKLTADLDKTILKKTFAEIDDLNKAILLLTVAQMKKFPVLIINNIAKGIPLQDHGKIREILEDFRIKDITIFNFCTDDSFIVYKPDKWATFYLENGEYCDIMQKNNG